MNDIERARVAGIAASLTAAWNSGDGAAFGRSFADEADFVNIYAKHVVGRDAIAAMHQTIFDGVYRGSRIVFTVETMRPVTGNTLLAHVRAELHVPQTPAALEMRTLATAVLVRANSGWLITSFHNTREQSPPTVPPA